MTIPDDLLSAFIDGELDAADRIRVATAIEADPALKRRIEDLRAAGLAFAGAIADIDTAPMPAGVTALLKEPKAENVVEFPRKRAPSAAPRWAMPLAAALALGAGVGIGVLVSGDTQGATMLAGLVKERALVAALETGDSGRTFALEGGRTASLVLSFKNPAGAYCREFTLADSAESARAIACREEGAWSVKVAAAEARLDEGGYGTAASGVSAAFDDAAGALGADAPLDPAAEKALIAAGWAR